MDDLYLEYNHYRVNGASVIDKRYIDDIETVIWRRFDQALLPGVSFMEVAYSFDRFLKKIVGRRNPDFKISRKCGKEITFLVQTSAGWCAFGSLVVRLVTRTTKLEILENIE